MESVIDQTVIVENLKPTETTSGEKVWEQTAGLPPEVIGPIRWDHPNNARLQVITRDGKREIAHTRPKRSKVCIVGYAENSRHLAWWDDPDCEIWGVNQLYRFIPRADRWFQIHTDWHDEKKWAEGADLRAWLTDCPIPVYMLADEPDIPNALAYPKDWVKQQLGVHEYFTSTIAFMVALAIAEGFQTIGIYGIDLIVGREYHFEKACVEFYLGIAHARGITYSLPVNSAILWQSHTYGFEKEPDYGFYGLEKLRKRSNELADMVKNLTNDVHKIQGRLDEADFLMKAMKDEPSRAKMKERIGQIERDLSSALNRLYLHDGAHQEVSRMFGLLELRARGGQVS